MPKVSVIMPLYNAENYVYKAIQSVLQQTYEDFELILIDDCCTDKTIQIIERIQDNRIKLYRNSKNEGIAKARNFGISMSKGEYIALMDDDDIAPPERLEKEVSFLDKYIDIDVVGGRCCFIDEKDNIIKWCDEPLMNPFYIRASLMFYDPIANGSALIRKSFIEQYELKYQDECLGMEDYLFWINCSLYGRISNIREVMLYWRCSTNNESARVQKEKEKERAKLFGELQRYALIKNGFELSELEMQLFIDMFTENMAANKCPIDKMENLYEVLRTISKQAEIKNMENEKEVKIACRKMFSKRLEFSSIWEDEE